LPVAAGLGLGLRVLRERKQRNSIASVLLLTDGQDAGSLNMLDSVMRDLPSCSIHCFGFGSDHDAKVCFESLSVCASDRRWWNIDRLRRRRC
jgi:hypothetical protein